LRSPSALVAAPTPTLTPSDGFVRLRNEALALRHSLMESFAASPVGRDPRQAVPSEAQAAAELVTQWMMVERFLEELAQRCEVPISASHVAPIRSPDPPARAHPV